ncbi:hypothetical protein EVG20_g5930 [Dentipellis fragilis]|uniref:Uncharacterized protein n=1 Tax=Dentipellis fragilis TaxID=205917 RepID=A0A4Y9YRY7_9AGAM|nr:hypothetical protein EVG20_g5930 [Dentipellis fragilis]
MSTTRGLSISLPDMGIITSPSATLKRLSPTRSFSFTHFPSVGLVRRDSKATGLTYTGTAPPKRDPFHPSPPSLSRRPDPQCTYLSLRQSLRIPSKSKHGIGKGFVPAFPSPQLLAAHDVQPADISRLLEDCHLIGELGANQCVGACPPPTPTGAPGLPDFLAMEADRERVVDANMYEEDVLELLEAWDEEFFAPRKLHVSIEHASRRESDKRVYLVISNCEE